MIKVIKLIPWWQGRWHIVNAFRPVRFYPIPMPFFYRLLLYVLYRTFFILNWERNETTNVMTQSGCVFKVIVSGAGDIFKGLISNQALNQKYMAGILTT